MSQPRAHPLQGMRLGAEDRALATREALATTRTTLPELAGQRATIIGLAREGTALARYLARHGAQVTVSDIKPADQLRDRIAALGDAPVRLVLGGHPPDILDADMVYVSPGVPPDAPILVEGRRRGLRLSSATELFLARCRAPVVGVTGSSGKTTTTSLVGEMLRRSGWQTWVGGNIGRPLIEDVDEIQPDHRVVLELSSFQLENLPMSPHVAVVLNLTPDHLDRHPSFEAYRAAKLSILRHQTAGDVAVMNLDDPHTWGLAGEVRGSALWFSLMKEPQGDGGFLRDGQLLIRRAGETWVICAADEVRLRGRHNLGNILAACLASGAVGATVEAMAETARTFAGVPHRLELVAELDGLQFINDSIATSPARSMAAIRAFDQPIVLLAGGRHKNLPLDEWAQAVRQKVAHLILFGEAAPLLEEAVLSAGSPGPAVHRAGTLGAAVRLAVEVAPPGAVILLAPACTSFDAYEDYVKRGEHFRELVVQILGARTLKERRHGRQDDS